MKPESPYIRLQRLARQFVTRCLNAPRAYCWKYPAESLDARQSFYLTDLRERVKTAHLLGWDTHLVVEDNNLCVYFVKRTTSDDVPWELR